MFYFVIGISIAVAWLHTSESSQQITQQNIQQIMCDLAI